MHFFHLERVCCLIFYYQLFNYLNLPNFKGPRVCIGLRFGMMQARIGLAKTLLNFKLAMGTKTNDINFSKSHFIISNEGGIWLNLEKIY